MAAGVDLSALSRLTEQVSSKAEVTREKGRQMMKHRSDYVKLKTKLETLSDEMEHSVMVPMTSKAFMPGKLVHTNEILVLLGDNWFIETSARRAAEIAGRRLKHCDDILESLEQELELVEGWRKQAKMFGEEKQETVEITEDYDEETEKKWNEKHAENVRRERKATAETVDDDQELWQRLEELEVQEALEKEWEENAEEEESDIDESDEDDEESECTTDNIVSSDNDDDEDDLQATKVEAKRRVSWVTPVESTNQTSSQALDPLRTISFTHSDNPDPPEHVDDSDPKHPSDIVHYACRQPRSILKHTDTEILVKDGALDQQSDASDVSFNSKKVINIDPEHNPVQDVIVERSVTEDVVTEPEPEVRKVSKFKASRLKTKPQ